MRTMQACISREPSALEMESGQAPPKGGTSPRHVVGEWGGTSHEGVADGCGGLVGGGMT
jgi:hypothetical protein